jgi:small subunit ribosomal protein S16
LAFSFRLPASSFQVEGGMVGGGKRVAGSWELRMLAIRLRRTGSKKRPFFRVVVTDSRTARDSSFVEVLGFYNPRTKPETLELKRDRLEHWVKAGAVASDTVRTLVARMPPAPPVAEASATADLPAS